MFPTILIVDDEASILQSLKGLLTDEGFEVLTASNGYEALKVIEEESPDLVLLDIWMPGIDGIDTLKEIKKDNPHIQVIIITGHGNIDTAVRATKCGAFDFLEKPLSIDKVIVTINNALYFRQLEEENKYLRKKTIEKHSLTGTSTAIKELQQHINTISLSDAWILITGENGTGKELIARTIHQFSKRVESPMIDVNCALISEDLIESELFGHEKGAIPGASSKKIGKFEMANNGTLFLDEIGDMSLKTQGKILRVVEEQKFQRVGGGRDIHVNVRIIAATNKNLEEEIKQGRFREELYYRLNVVPIHAPSLRDRIDDIPLLAATFLKEFAKDNQTSVKDLSPNVIQLFKSYNWPGNVREMKNLLGRLAITVDDQTIELKDVPPPYNPKYGMENQFVDTFFEIPSLREAQKAFERSYIINKVKEYAGNLAETARNIGISELYIKNLLHKKGH